MSIEPNAYQFDPSTVSRLFKLCDLPEEGVQTQPSDCEKTGLLRDLLAEIPPLNNAALTGVPEILRHLHRVLPRAHGRSLDQILQDSVTSLAELRSVKDYAKSLVSKAKTESEHEAAGVIYYAAIAHALIHHGIRITQQSCEQLQDSFASLPAKGWIPEDFRSLFIEARRACTQHMRNDETAA